MRINRLTITKTEAKTILYFHSFRFKSNKKSLDEEKNIAFAFKI